MQTDRNAIISSIKAMVKQKIFCYNRLYFLIGLKPVLRIEKKKNMSVSNALAGLKSYKKCIFGNYIFVSRDLKCSELAVRLTKFQNCKKLMLREKMKKEIFLQYGCYLQPASLRVIPDPKTGKGRVVRFLPPENENNEINTCFAKLYGYPVCCSKIFPGIMHRNMDKETRLRLTERIHFKYRDVLLKLTHMHCTINCRQSRKMIIMIKEKLDEIKIPDELLRKIDATKYHKENIKFYA